MKYGFWNPVVQFQGAQSRKLHELAAITLGSRLARDGKNATVGLSSAFSHWPRGVSSQV